MIWPKNKGKGNIVCFGPGNVVKASKVCYEKQIGKLKAHTHQ
jgi:hypothetical protein